MSNKDRLKGVLLAAFLNLAVLLLFWWLCPPTFTETNDDMIMASFAYGYMTEKSAYLAYINVMYGMILNVLLALFPHVAWYSILQVMTVYVSSTVICFLILRTYPGKKAILPLSFYYLFFGYDLFCSLQFSRTAFVASFAGLFLLLHYASRKNQYKYRTDMIFAGFLAVWGSLYRFKMFAVACAILVVLGIIAVFRYFKKGNYYKAFKFCVPFLIVISVSIGVHLFSEYAYNHHPGWKNFKDINGVRDALQYCLVHPDDVDGYPDYEKNREFYESLDITEQDLVLFRSNLADPNFLNLETLNLIYSKREKKVIDFTFFKDMISHLSKTFAGYQNYPALLLAIWLSILMCTYNKSLTRTLVLVFSCIVFMAFQTYFFFRGRFAIKRVDTPIILGIVILLMLTCWNKLSDFWDNTKLTAILSVCVFLINVPAFTGYADRKVVLQEGQAAQQEIRSLISSDKEHFYFYYVNWSQFPDVMYDIWHVGEPYCGANTSSLGSWRVTTPIVIEKWARYGVKNPYKDMVDNNSIYCMSTSQSHINSIVTHIKQHYNANATAHLIRDIGTNKHYYIYRIGANGPRPNLPSAKDGTGIINHSFEIEKDNLNVHISGYAYIDGNSSFATNLYLGWAQADGSEKLRYLVQKVQNEEWDNLHGKFSAFDVEITLPFEDSAMNLYCQLQDGTMYRIPVV